MLFAGSAVLISLCGMFLMGLAFMNGLAIGAITGVLMMMAASLTLLPAFLAIVGRRVNTTTRAALGAVTLFIQHRPWPVLVGATGFLILLTVPLFSIRLGFGDTGNLPERQTARRAYDLLATGFGPGIGGPIIVTVAGDAAGNQVRLDEFASTIAAADGVATAPAPQVSPMAPDLALIQVFPAQSPQDAATEQLVNDLRNDIIPASGLDTRRSAAGPPAASTSRTIWAAGSQF